MRLSSFALNLRYAWTPRKPRLMARLVANVLAVNVLRRERLRYVDVSITTACNLRCEHCFATAFKPPPGARRGRPELDLDAWARVVEECEALGCVAFGITGGEPLLYKDLVPLVGRLHPERNLISVSTNGTLLNAARARQLHDAGVDVVQMSLDSADPDEHDAFRREPGAWQATFDAVRIARGAGLKVVLGSTIHHGNVRSRGILGMIALTRQLGCALVFGMAAPSGEWRGRHDVLLSDDDIRAMRALVAANPHVRTDMESTYGPFGCGAANEKLYITPYGDVIPCPYMHISFGQVGREPIRDIRARMLEQPRLRGYGKVCLVGEDRDFIDQVMVHATGRETLATWDECFTAAATRSRRG